MIQKNKKKKSLKKEISLKEYKEFKAWQKDMKELDDESYMDFGGSEPEEIIYTYNFNFSFK